MEGGKPKSMLETCATVPDPPCRRCTDSTGSVWLREAAQLMACSLIFHSKNSFNVYSSGKGPSTSIPYHFPVIDSIYYDHVKRSLFVCPSYVG